MARALFFHIVLRKFMENTSNKPIFSQYNTFYKFKHIFSICVVIFFNQCEKSQSNQEQCSLCCSSPCFCVVARLVFVFCCTVTTGRCNAFQHIFVNKKVLLLRPIFPDYVVSCDYFFSL